MTRLYSYNPKDYKARNFACGLLNTLHKQKITTQIIRDRGVAYISIEDQVKAVADKIYTDYTIKIQADKFAFSKAIKVNYSLKSNNTYKVSFLYNKLRKTSIGQNIYLPDEWKDGKSIQNYDQNDFYSFFNVMISKSKQLDGERIIVKTLSQKKVWILYKTFMQDINGYLEDCQLSHMYVTTMDELLDGMCIQSFKGSEWKNFIDTKKLFEI